MVGGWTLAETFWYLGITDSGSKSNLVFWPFVAKPLDIKYFIDLLAILFEITM